MFLRLLLESLRRGSRRKLVAVAAIALGVLTSTAILECLLASGDRLATEMRSYGANLEILPAAGNATFDAAELVRLRHIFWANNIVAVAPFLPLRVRFEPAATVAPLVGTWFDVPLGGDGFHTGLPAVRPTLEVSGRWPRDGAAEAALGRRLAARLGAAPGGELTVELAGRRERLRVVGLVASGGEEEEEAFAPLAAVRGLIDGPAPSGGSATAVTRAEVFALTNPEATNVRDPSTLTPEEYDRWYCTAYPSSVAHQISEALPGARAGVVTAVTGATAEILGRLRAVLLALAAVALGGAAVGVSAAMTATVLERRLEAALLVALGAERWKVALFFVSEALVLGAVGGLAGGGAGLLAGRLLGRAVFGVAVGWLPQLLPLAVAAGMLLAGSGAILPVLRALERHPAALLKRATA